jgi:hypothetical protein
VGEADHPLGYAAKEETDEPTMAAAADDHQIGLPVPSCRDDFFGGVTERWLGGDPRRAFRLCLSARVVKDVWAAAWPASLELTALRLKHIANDDPCSFRDEQASIGRALASADEYDFPFEAIHLFSLHCLPNVGTAISDARC